MPAKSLPKLLLSYWRMENSKYIIAGSFVLPMDKKMSVIENGGVVVNGGNILAVGEIDKIIKDYKDYKLIDTGLSIVMPGLINTHTHAAMTYFRGLADDIALDEWLQKYIWPAEGKFVDEQFVAQASELACLEMLSAGVTCFNDMYFFADITAKIVKKSGIRVALGEAVLDFSTPSSQSPDDAIARTKELLQEYKNDEMVNIVINPHSTYTCGPKTLKKALGMAKDNNIPTHIHISETQKEVRDSLKKYHKTPVELLDAENLLNNKVIAVHSIWLEPQDIEIFKKNNAKVSHNPVSNMKLASGTAPLSKFLSTKEITVGLATDGAASNNTLDMFSDMFASSLLHKSHQQDPSFLNAREIVKMATINAAKVLSMDEYCGSLEPDKRADIIVIDIDKPHLTPLYDPYSHIVYCANGSDVKHVFINGRQIMKDRQVLTIDREKTMYEARSFNKKI